MTRSYSPFSISAKRSLSCALEPMSELRITGRAPGNRPATSSATRSIPGPMGISESTVPHSEQVVGPLLLVPAMMAHQHAAEAVLDQPRIAIGALILMPAGAAERQRRVAPAVEEQQRLLAAVEGRENLAGEARRDPLAFFRRLLAHIERGDVGQRRIGEARGQQHMAVAAEIGVVARFDRGRGRAEDHPRLGEFGAHHRHVAGVVVDPVRLLEGAVVLLVEDDQPELVERQEQRRARPDHGAHRAVIDAAPGAGALRRRHVRMPLGRPRAEAAGEAVEEGMGERDLGQQHHRLPPGAQRIGHGLEEHFGLAAAGDAIEQRHAEARGIDLADLRQRQRLLGAERRRRRIGIGRQHDRRRRRSSAAPAPRPARAPR